MRGEPSGSPVQPYVPPAIERNYVMVTPEVRRLLERYEDLRLLGKNIRSGRTEYAQHAESEPALPIREISPSRDDTLTQEDLDALLETVEKHGWDND